MEGLGTSPSLNAVPIGKRSVLGIWLSFQRLAGKCRVDVPGPRSQLGRCWRGHCLLGPPSLYWWKAGTHCSCLPGVLRSHRGSAGKGLCRVPGTPAPAPTNWPQLFLGQDFLLAPPLLRQRRRRSSCSHPFRVPTSCSWGNLFFRLWGREPKT